MKGNKCCFVASVIRCRYDFASYVSNTNFHTRMTFSVVFYISGPFESKWKKIYSEVKKKHLGVRENVPGNFSKQRFRQQ